MTYKELLKAIVRALYKPGRSGEQAREMADYILLLMDSVYTKAQVIAYFEVLLRIRITEKPGSMVRVKGDPRKLQEFPNLVEKRTSDLFRKLLHTRVRHVLKKANLTLDEVLESLRSK